MKITTLLTVTLFTIIPFCVLSQAPPKGVSKIILTVVEDSQDINYKSVSKFLIENGYPLINTDSELGYIKTGNKSITWQGFWQISVSVSINKNMITFYGQTFLNDGGGLKDIKNKGMLGDMSKKSFNELYNLAKSYPHYKINYQ